jgi:hypothetical protein
MSSGQHEVGLRIHFPEYEVARNHGSPFPAKAERNIITLAVTNGAWRSVASWVNVVGG